MHTIHAQILYFFPARKSVFTIFHRMKSMTAKKPLSNDLIMVYSALESLFEYTKIYTMPVNDSVFVWKWYNGFSIYQLLLVYWWKLCFFFVGNSHRPSANFFPVNVPKITPCVCVSLVSFYWPQSIFYIMVAIANVRWLNRNLKFLVCVAAFFRFELDHNHMGAHTF